MTAALRPRTRTLLSSFLSFSFFLLRYSAVCAGRSLTGRVVDPDGRAVANAEVIVTGVAAAPLRARSDSRRQVRSSPVSMPAAIASSPSAPGLVSDATAIDVTASPATRRHHAAPQRGQRDAGRLGGADRSAAVAHARQRDGDSRIARSRRSSSSRWRPRCDRCPASRCSRTAGPAR